MTFAFTPPPIPPQAPPPNPGNSAEDDSIEKRTQELILMTNGKGPRRWRQRKTEYLQKLEQDNAQLKTLIIEIQQQISALMAQNDILRDQLMYFQSCLVQAPFGIQPNNDKPSH